MEQTTITITDPTDRRLVHTTHGLVPFGDMDVREVRSNGPNDVCVGREYWLNGELVRRDAWATILRGESATAEKGAL